MEGQEPDDDRTGQALTQQRTSLEDWQTAGGLGKQTSTANWSCSPGSSAPPHCLARALGDGDDNEARDVCRSVHVGKQFTALHSLHGRMMSKVTRHSPTFSILSSSSHIFSSTSTCGASLEADPFLSGPSSCVTANPPSTPRTQGFISCGVATLTKQAAALLHPLPCLAQEPFVSALQSLHCHDGLQRPQAKRHDQRAASADPVAG